MVGNNRTQCNKIIMITRLALRNTVYEGKYKWEDGWMYVGVKIKWWTFWLLESEKEKQLQHNQIAYYIITHWCLSPVYSFWHYWAFAAVDLHNLTSKNWKNSRHLIGYFGFRVVGNKKLLSNQLPCIIVLNNLDWPNPNEIS